MNETRYQSETFISCPDLQFLGKEGDSARPYLFSERVAIAVDVALATDRPLLVAGRPGCGKSRLADAMAAVLGWNCLTWVMTSRTRLEELTVEVDHLRRLHDANSKDDSRLKPDSAYWIPGIFWWAFAPESAATRNGGKGEGKELQYPGLQGSSADTAQHTVLLVDEIDKAEPDVPNDLLDLIDRRRFKLPDGTPITSANDQKLLTIITTNRERELPPAFVRRCVCVVVEDPDRDALIKIAQMHHPDTQEDLVTALADKVITMQAEAQKRGVRAPGTSEFLDAIRACEQLNVRVDDGKGSLWSHVEQAILRKPHAL